MHYWKLWDTKSQNDELKCQNWSNDQNKLINKKLNKYDFGDLLAGRYSADDLTVYQTAFWWFISGLGVAVRLSPSYDLTDN